MPLQEVEYLLEEFNGPGGFRTAIARIKQRENVMLEQGWQTEDMQLPEYGHGTGTILVKLVRQIGPTISATQLAQDVGITVHQATVLINHFELEETNDYLHLGLAQLAGILDFDTQVKAVNESLIRTRLRLWGNMPHHLSDAHKRHLAKEGFTPGVVLNLMHHQLADFAAAWDIPLQYLTQFWKWGTPHVKPDEKPATPKTYLLIRPKGNDFDVAVSATLEELRHTFSRKIPIKGNQIFAMDLADKTQEAAMDAFLKVSIGDSGQDAFQVILLEDGHANVDRAQARVARIQERFGVGVLAFTITAQQTRGTALWIPVE